ncbi:Helix-turn-helix domain protein [compost metagenome]
MDWRGQLRRYRKARGFTQAALAELLGVEQATVSRWECGTHEPELGVQRRLRDMIYGRGPGSDHFIYSSVSHSPFAVKLATKSAKNIAASRLAADFHGVVASSLGSADYRPFFTEELESNWGRAVEMGFFAGELISVQVYNRWMPLCGSPAKACMSYWTPARLSDGEIVLLSEFRLLDEEELTVVPPDARFVPVSMDAAVG